MTKYQDHDQPFTVICANFRVGGAISFTLVVMEGQKCFGLLLLGTFLDILSLLGRQRKGHWIVRPDGNSVQQKRRDRDGEFGAGANCLMVSGDYPTISNKCLRALTLIEDTNTARILDQ